MATASSPQIKVITLRDFTGGLNRIADPANLKLNEVSDVADLDFLPSGGVVQRSSRVDQEEMESTATMTDIGWIDDPTDGAAFLFFTQDSVSDVPKVWYFGSAIITGSAGDTYSNVVSFNGVGYLSGSAGAWKIDPVTQAATSLSDNGFNDDISAPNNGNLPRAKCLAAFQGYLWAGNTSGGDSNDGIYTLRFSHPNKPEDWRTDDYFQVGLGDGQPITALCPLGDSLVIFKTSSVWLVQGYSPDTFQLVPISHLLGVADHKKVASTESGVVFGTQSGGIYLFNGSSFSLLSEKLGPIDVEAIGYGRDYDFGGAAMTDSKGFRVWVSDGSSTTYVYNPAISAWTRYTFGPTAFAARPPVFSIAFVIGNYWGQLDFGSPFTDSVGTGGATFADSAIVPYFETGWLDAGSPVQKKRWKRLETLIDFSVPTNPRTIQVTLCKDWDSYNESTLTIDPAESTGSAANRDLYVRGPSLGSGRAVKLRFTGLSNGVVDDGPLDLSPWGVDAIILKYLPRRIR